MGKLGFEGVDPAATGRPAYHPAVLLKLYIGGYLNRIQSSRRLEREAQRNVELMCSHGSAGRLISKTIANFRKDNGKAIRAVCKQFVVLCQQLVCSLMRWSQSTVASSKPSITGTGILPAPSYNDGWKKLNQASIATWPHSIRPDRQEPMVARLKTERLHDKIAALKDQMKALKEIEVQLEKVPDKQISLTDPTRAR